MPDALPPASETARLDPSVHGARFPLAAGTALTLCGSALMVFWVQPLVSRLALPVLGGAPNVWNTCSLFFQACLLAGYAYAHVLTSSLRPRAQVAVHAALLAAGLAALPIGIDLTNPPDPDGSPVLWLLGHLALGCGLPFVALSATAPLLQRWFSYSDHKDAADPYFLYAASNVGSLLALTSYPTVIERVMGLSSQSSLWTAGYLLVAAGVLATGIAVARAPVMRTPSAAARSQAPGAATTLRWLALAFVPSGLMLATTTHITTNIASAPLLWIIPLTIYIGTFVLAFSGAQAMPSRMLLRAQALGLGAALVVLVSGLRTPLLLLVPLTGFALTALVCHRILAATRPAADRLTGFYLIIATGGVLGGVFNAILAPLVFPDIWEYPLLLIAACALRPKLGSVRPFGMLQMTQAFVPTALVIVAAALPLLLGASVLISLAQAAAVIAFAAIASRPARAVVAAALIATLSFATIAKDGRLYAARSFFGAYQVQRLADLDVMAFRHGETIHNAESTRPGEALMPITYFHPGGPFYEVIGAPGIGRIGVTGLGIGAIACDARPGQSVKFYEIDPLVVSIARDTRFFHQVSGCGDREVVTGDARLTLAREPDGAFDLLILDAFSSDAVPVHLLTREAMALYWQKLAPAGVLLIHVSNGYLDLKPAMAAMARDMGAYARTNVLPPDPSTIRVSKAQVIVVTRNPARLDLVAPAPRWVPLPAPLPIAWTDDRANVLQALRWGAPGR